MTQSQIKLDAERLPTIQEFLEVFDGNGLIITDDELIAEYLAEMGKAPFDLLTTYKPSEVETWKCSDCGGDCSAITCPENKNSGDYTECQNCHEEISWELFANNTGLCFECSDQLQ